MNNEYGKDEYSFFGRAAAALAIIACVLWLVAMIIAPAALIKYCWAFLVA